MTNYVCVYYNLNCANKDNYNKYNTDDSKRLDGYNLKKKKKRPWIFHLIC